MEYLENLKDKELEALEVKVKKEREARRRKGSGKEIKELKSSVKKLKAEYDKLCKEFKNPAPIEIKAKLLVAFKPQYDDFYNLLEISSDLCDDDVFFSSGKGELVKDKKLNPATRRAILQGMRDVLDNACEDLGEISPFNKKRADFVKKLQALREKWEVSSKEFGLKIEDLKD